MPRPIQAQFPKYFRSKTIVAIGDSFCKNYATGVRPDEMWPAQTAKLLRDLGANCKALNYGLNGDTSGTQVSKVGVLNRISSCFWYGEQRIVPELVVILVGTNDTDPSVTAQANIEACIIALKNKCVDPQKSDTNGLINAVVTNPSNLPAGKPTGTRYLVKSDNSTTGGIASADPDGPTTLTGTLTGPRVWYCRSPQAGESGWSRITPLNDGVSRIVVMSYGWLNYSGGGDTLAGGESHAVERAAQSAAATAQSVVFYDPRIYMRTFVNSGAEGIELSGTFSVDPTGGNSHPSAHACYLYAKGLVATIQAQNGWLAALS